MKQAYSRERDNPLQEIILNEYIHSEKCEKYTSNPVSFKSLKGTSKHTYITSIGKSPVRLCLKGH